MVQKQIQSALTYWLRLGLASLLLASPLALSSCRKRTTTIIDVKPVERAPLDLPPLAPLQLDGINWYVVTENNSTDIITKLKSNGLQPALFSLDEKGYEKLAENMTKIRGYIASQKAIIAALKDYYKVPDNPQALTPPLTKLTQGSGSGPIVPTTAPTTAAPVAAPAAQASSPAIPAATATTTAPKKRMVKLIPPFMKK